MCGFHSSGRPKVWRTQIKPGTKFFDLFIWKNILEMTLCTAENRQLRRERSLRKKCRSSSSMVKTQCLCATDQFKRHGSSPVEGIFSTAGRTESGMTAERGKFERTTVRASIHGTAIGRIPTIFFVGYILHE